MTVAKNDVWLKQSPIDQIEGSNVSIPYTVVFDGITTVAVNAITVYKDGQDVTSTVMPSGNHTVAGNRLTMKALTALEYPGDYIIVMEVDVDGVDDGWKLKVRAQQHEGED